MQLLIRRKNILFWLDLSVFSYWTPWVLKANIRVVSLIFCVLLAWGRFPKTIITREQKKNIFWLIKNKDKVDHLHFYYINKEQKLVVMHLKLIFTGIKTERGKVAEVPKIAYLWLKQVGKIICVRIKTSKKYGLCWIWSRENSKAET